MKSSMQNYIWILQQIFKFYYQIINGFELASSINEDDLDTKVIIDIGDKKDIIQTETS